MPDEEAAVRSYCDRAPVDQTPCGRDAGRLERRIPPDHDFRPRSLYRFGNNGQPERRRVHRRARQLRRAFETKHSEEFPGSDF